MIYVFLADGFEEVEALTPVDLLRRGGMEVVTVGVGSNIITGSHGITVVPDIIENDVVLDDSVDMVVLPGGMPGTVNLEHSQTVLNAVRFCYDNGKKVAAICAAPSILGHMGLLKGKQAVCFEGFESQLEGAEVLCTPVCVSGNIITARGAGVALDFALKLVEVMTSEERSRLLAASLQCVK